MRAFLTNKWQRCRDTLATAWGGFIYLVVKWNELWLFAALFLLWPVASWGLRMLDPTAAPLDVGVLHSDYYAMLKFAGFYGFVWLGLKLNQPTIFRFFEDTFTEKHFYDNLTPWQQYLIAFFCLALHLAFAGVCMLAAKAW